jgi:hypothetical protein
MPTQLPEYYTADQLAGRFLVHKDTIIKLFEHRPGVIDLGTRETRSKRRRRVLRIPRATVEKFLIERRVQ